jgi:hypothetical protein
MIIMCYGWKMDVGNDDGDGHGHVGDDVRDVICDNLCNFTSLLKMPIFSSVMNCF